MVKKIKVSFLTKTPKVKRKVCSVKKVNRKRRARVTFMAKAKK